MNRRTFIVTAAALLTGPLGANAQQTGKVYRIGLLYIGGPNPTQAHPDAPEGRAFREGLRELGWVEGHTVTIDWRAAGGAPERLDALATELVRAGGRDRHLRHPAHAGREAGDTEHSYRLFVRDPSSGERSGGQPGPSGR